MFAKHNRSSAKVLALELKRLQDDPVEGFTISLANNSNLYEWNCSIYGPPDTIYEGGYFKAVIRFPFDYPYSPPNVRFHTKMWHPNIYENGEVCISILHPPVDDPESGELPSERWTPTQSVRTIILSIISLLMEPNISSPANVDASVMYKRWRAGEDSDYANYVKRQVSDSRQEALKENVFIPTNQEEYLMINKKSKSTSCTSKRISDTDTMMEDDMFNDDYAYDSYSESSSSESDDDVEDTVDDKDMDDESCNENSKVRRSRRLKNRDDSLIS